MMLIHGLPDPQGSNGNKTRSHRVEERKVVEAGLIPSLTKLDLTDRGGERIQENRSTELGERTTTSFCFSCH